MDVSTSSDGWVVRGGNYNTGANAGVFNFDSYNGTAYGANGRGARAVLLIDYNIMPNGNFSKYKFKDLYHK